MASSVSELDTSLAYNVSDPPNPTDGQTWTQVQRLQALNESQVELINKLLGMAVFNEKVYELLSEIQVSQEGSFPSTGLNMLNDISERYYMVNGFVALRGELSDKIKFLKKITASNLGETNNSFKAGSNASPKCYIFGNVLNALISFGYFPFNYKLYYIGRPYTMVTTGASVSGKNTTVSIPELNVSMHEILLKIAEMKLLKIRMDEKDIARIQLLNGQIKEEIESLTGGKMGEPGDKEPKIGNYQREGKKE